MAEKKNSKACLYMALGCFGIIVLIGIGIAILFWWGAQKAQEIQEQIKDPVAREAKVKEMLGTETLPEGYYAGFAMRIPFAMDMVILSDKPPEVGANGEVEQGGEPDFDNQAFMYFRMLQVVNFLSDEEDTQKIRDFVEGKTTDPQALREQGINVDMKLGSQIATGEVRIENQRVLYNAFRGRLDNDSKEKPGLVTLMMIECDGEKGTRMAFWATADPQADVALEEADYNGTAASDSGVQTFMGNFRLCQ